jgi:hypothetical protein
MHFLLWWCDLSWCDLSWCDLSWCDLSWHGDLSGPKCDFSIFPVNGDRPNIINNKVVITVIVIKGINTINHDIIVNPRWQRRFSKNVKIIITINFTKAVLYICLNKSTIIWVREKAIYNKAGAQKSLKFIYIIQPF